MSTKKTEDYIKPNRITDRDSGAVYELDFSRESVKFAEARGFDPDEVSRYPVSKIPEFFFYAFRKNHKNLARTQTDNLLERLGGLSPAFVERLSQLYVQAATANMVVEKTEDMGKNGNLAVELD